MKIVFLGCTNNFGFGFGAVNTKVNFMCKGLQSAGASCVVHNGIIGLNKLEHDSNIKYDNIEVTSLKQLRYPNITFLFNLPKLYKFLKKEKVKNEKNIAILEYNYFHIFLLYVILLRIFGYQIVDISHEWLPTIHSRTKFQKYSKLIFAKYFGYLVDAILPISEYIIRKIKHFDKPYFKLPIMANFDDTFVSHFTGEKKFVYCASLDYYRIVQMIVNSYSVYILNGGSIKMVFILNGTINKIEQIKEYIDAKHLSSLIEIKTILPFKDLLNEFRNAAGLIIPLDPHYEQDEARFSQKIAEYLSSKSPIITTNVGEIKYYFDSSNVVLCEFSESGFADAFKWIELNPMEASNIGIRGYEKGRNTFNYKNLGLEMYEFFKLL